LRRADGQAGDSETAIKCVLRPGRWLVFLTTRPAEMLLY
jgi:hypothetical protein